jgi:hypothetical protein
MYRMDTLVEQALADCDDDSVRAILAQVCALTDMGFAALARVTENRWITCQVLDKIEFGLTPGGELEVQTTICNEIRQHGRAVIFDDATINPDWRTHPVPILYGFKSYASFPIFLSDGRFYGTLCAIDPARRRVTNEDVVATLQAYAAQIGRLISARHGDGEVQKRRPCIKHPPNKAGRLRSKQPDHPGSSDQLVSERFRLIWIAGDGVTLGLGAHCRHGIPSAVQLALVFLCEFAVDSRDGGIGRFRRAGQALVTPALVIFAVSFAHDKLHASQAAASRMLLIGVLPEAWAPDAIVRHSPGGVKESAIIAAKLRRSR